MKSAVRKRSIVIDGHKTSVSLEDAFWARLKAIAARRRQTVSGLVAGIDIERQHSNLSSAIRLFVLDHCPLQPAELPLHVAPDLGTGDYAGLADRTVTTERDSAAGNGSIVR